MINLDELIGVVDQAVLRQEKIVVALDYVSTGLFEHMAVLMDNGARIGPTQAAYDICTSRTHQLSGAIESLKVLKRALLDLK